MMDADGTRYGQVWVDSDYQRLVDALRAGLDDEEVAGATGRMTILTDAACGLAGCKVRPNRFHCLVVFSVGGGAP